MAGRPFRQLNFVIGVTTAVWLVAIALYAAPASPRHATLVPSQKHAEDSDLFQSSDRCLPCHNGVMNSQGEDISISAEWRSSMMANSVRDPYWQAAVRREILDHPEAQEEIEDECSICHMPMTTFAARKAGGKGRIFPYLPVDAAATDEAALAADGVSCSVCHQMSATRLGDPSTFTGGYIIDTAPGATRPVFGPFAVDPGRQRVMQSSSTFTPTQAEHVQRSEMCASCHTLFTRARSGGSATGTRLPEQMPYLEWQQSEFSGKSSCQSCHMPEVAGEAPVTSVLGQPRPGVSRHSFRGGNFFMLRVLNTYRDELGVRATTAEMSAAIQRTVDHLQQDTGRVSIATAERAGGRLIVDVDVSNLTGHKFPTAYPSRRAWLHVTVTDSTGRAVFTSGAFTPDGKITGNDNDADPLKFEPHFLTIDRADQVQIYESMMVDTKGALTTGLLSGARYIKDNRLLPRGFDKTKAPTETAVVGEAREDADFSGGRDRVRYSIDPGSASGDLTVIVKLWYQPIGFRWADNLRSYNAFEPQRFVRYYESLASASAIVVSEAHRTVGR